MHNPVAFVIHVEGLINLLKEHKKHLSDLDDQEKLISTIIFQSTCGTGVRASDLFLLSALPRPC
jgi:hypothetical protein